MRPDGPASENSDPPGGPVFDGWGANVRTVTAAAIELIQITKRFPGVIANDRIDLAVQEGEIHAVVGENGADPVRDVAPRRG